MFDLEKDTYRLAVIKIDGENEEEHELLLLFDQRGLETSLLKTEIDLGDKEVRYVLEFMLETAQRILHTEGKSGQQ